ncbi:MAG TPA: hypothetical protein VHI55_13365 [Gaiellaceae bacterium]|jgi:hypothetical protein|nr:hypothetical protein [Gaiellaceae bacterium]
MPRSRRRENLSFTHHVLIAPLPLDEQIVWLDRAERERLSTRELAAAIESTREFEPAAPEGCPDIKEVAQTFRDELREQLIACGYDEDIRVEVEVSAPGLSDRVTVEAGEQ